MYKLVSAEEAISLIKDYDIVAVNGQTRMGVPEKFYQKLVESFEKTGRPKNIRPLSSSSFPAMKVMAGHQGLLREVVLAHWHQLMSDFSEDIGNNYFDAYALPQGYLAINYSEAARRVPGFLSRVGLHTSVDPRYGCIGINSTAKKQFATPVTVDGKEYLFYKTIIPNVCVIRGTTADKLGNITMEHEGLITDAMEMAIATHNNGGIVIVQVERTSSTPADPHEVVVPGCLVDYVYIDSEQVMMDDSRYNPLYSGEKHLEGEDLKTHLQDVYRKAIARRSPSDISIAKRAALELGSCDIVNLGIGIPSIIPFVAEKMGRSNEYVTYTIECGALGGIPTGYSFGANVNVEAIIPQDAMFRLYEGKGLDLTGVGALEIDRHGNVNVLRKGKLIVGMGGFNYVTTGAKKLLVMSRFMVGSEINNQDGKLVYTDGKISKFCEEIEHIDFAVDIAIEENQEVLYITERCVFKLSREGLMLIEVAPGLDVEKDVVAKLPFRPLVSPSLKEMPWECFCE